MSYRRQIKYKQMRDARIYGGNYGAGVDENGKSWFQNKREQDPTFGNDMNRNQLDDAYWADKRGDQGNAPRLPNVNDLSQRGVTVNTMPNGYSVGDNGLLLRNKTVPQNYGPNSLTGNMVIKPQYQTVWLNGDPLQGAEAQAKLQQQKAFNFANPDQVKAGQAGWADVQVADRKALLSDPNFYKNNKIMEYDTATQQEMFKDPNFDWSQLPKAQKAYFDLSSSPTAMGAAQGLAMGAGNPGGAASGALIAAAAAWAGYDQNKEFWQQGDGKFTLDTQQLKDLGNGVMGFMNYAAEVAEKTIGTAAMAANAMTDPTRAVKDVLNKDTWNSNISFFEAITPAYVAAAGKQALGGNERLGMEDAAKLIPVLFTSGAMKELITNPEKYKGKEYYLGAALPVELEQSWVQRLDEARAKVAAGGNEREIMSEMQNGLMAQAGDMIGQAIFDPLNVVGGLGTFFGKATSKVTGNKVAEAAFTGTTGLTEAKARYRNLVQTEGYKVIDPNFDPKKMNWLSKQIAGVTLDKAGNITNKAGGFTKAGLLDPIKPDEYVSGPVKSWKDAGGFVKMMLTEEPKSRAETGAVLFKDNIVAMLGMFDNSREGVREFVKYLKALASNDMDTWSQLGGKFANSPEFYTVLPALKDANTNVIDGIIQMMDLTETNSDYLKTIEDILGDTKGKLIEDIAYRGTFEQDLKRIEDRVRASTDPRAKALLAEIEAGKVDPKTTGVFTADTLKQIVGIFTGKGALPRTPEHWKALISAELSDHYGEWAAKNFQLDKSPEAKSAFFRTMGILKTAQSILLLGGSPGYAIQNGLSGMVHLAASGMYGMMSPKSIDDFTTRMGAVPSRMEEGVGIGGVVDASSVKGGGAIRDALKGEKGALRTTKETLGKLSSGMPMSKLSSWFEKLNSKQAFAQGMKSMWSQSWRRGVGFSKMKPELVNMMKQMGINPENIYAAIEAGMNQAEIEKALFGRYEGVQSRSLIHDAAQRTGQSASQAAAMLEKLGVLDQLDKYLKGQTTPDGINAAFNKAVKVAKDQIDIRMGEDLARKADAVKQRVGLEGAASGLDVIQQAHSNFTDVWMDHYFKLGEVFENLQDIPDEKMKSRAVEEAYRQSDAEFLRMYANNGASYKGIFDAWGMSGNPDALNVLQFMGDGQAAMKTAYDTMRQLKKDHFETNWGGDIDAMFSNWDKINFQTDAAFKVAFDQKARADVKMGESLSKIYENLYGNKAVGEAARQWWEQVVKMNAEITSKERKARQDFAKLPKAQREIAKKKYYGETKQLQIAELEKINQEGIARLEKVIKGSGQGGAEAAGPTSPTPAPSPVEQVAGPQVESNKSNVDEFKEAQTAAEQRTATEQLEKQGRVDAVWDVAGNYWGKGANYSKTVLQDKFKLLELFHDPTLGGFKDLSGLDDARLTPDVVARVLGADELRQQVKVEAEAPMIAKGMKIGDNTSLLKAIAQHGGLAWGTARDLLGDKKPRTMPGTFTTKGVNIDLMARMLADDGFPIDLNNPDDIGGVGQAVELLSRAIAGDKIYPMSHDFDAANKAAELKYASEMMGEAITPEQKAMVEEVTGEPVFDAQAWEDAVTKAAQGDDLTAVYNAVYDNLPNELMDKPMFEGGETYREFIAHVTEAAEEANKIRNRDEAIAEHMTESELAISKQETKAESVMTRKTLEEKFTEAFGDTPQVQAFMSVFDAVVGTFAKITGEDVDRFTARYYADAMRSSETDFEDGLNQAYGRIDVAERTLAQVDFENLARMLVRGGEGELRRAIQAEPNKANRRAILEEVYKLDSKVADKVARSEIALFQREEMGNIDGRPIIDYVDGTPVFGRSELTVGKKTYRLNDVTAYAGGSNYIDTVSVEVSTKHKDGSTTWTKINDYPEEVANAVSSKLKEQDARNKQASNKGVVTFDGLQATIHAFEAADVTTLVHENAHVFMNMLKDVAARTGNERVVKDLATIMDHVRAEQVSDGVWKAANADHRITAQDGKFVYQGPTAGDTRVLDSFEKAESVLQQEVFARSWENYQATGKAPTPALVQAFRAFKNWMLDIYKSLSGSEINVKMSDEVKDVFGRMLGADGRTVPDMMGNPLKVGDSVGGMEVVDILPDGRVKLESEDGDTSTANPKKLQKEMPRTLSIGFDPQRHAAEQGVSQSTVMSLKEKLAAAKRGESVWVKPGGAEEVAPKGITDNSVLDLYQRNLKKVQDGQAQFDMFAERTVEAGQQTVSTEPAASPQVDMFGQSTQDTGTMGGMLPGMQESTGMMFDVQAGGGIKKMDTGKARSLFDVDPTRTTADKAGTALSAGDIVTDENGKRHNVKGANLRGKVLTMDGKILEPASVERVARQETFFQADNNYRRNVTKGKDALLKAISEKKDVPQAFYRDGVGEIDLVWGVAGDPAKEFKGGRGLSHIIEKRNSEGLNGVEFASNLYETIAKGEVVERSVQHGDPRIDIFYNDIQVVLVKEKGKNSWMLSGFIKREISDVTGDVRRSPSPTQPLTPSVSSVVGSGDSSNIAQGTSEINPKNDTLYQRAETPKPEKPEPINLGGEQPFGTLDAAAGDQGLFHGEVMDEGWRTQVQPLMDAMRAGALESLNNKPLDGATRDMSPEGQKMMRQYMKQVQNEMASTKLASMRWGETKRDEALLNYGKRYGIDRYLEVAYPYQFFYTRSMAAWAARAIDKPAWFANYARIKRQQDKYERDIPERLRGKIKINMPWMPDWMGDAMYIDPLANLFTPANYLKPFERMTKDSTMQQQEAERILQEWSADGQMSQTELNTALQSRSGTTWERAFAEAQIRRESEISNPLDFFNTMFGPAWYLTTPYKLLNGEASGVTSTPLLNTSRAIDTVTQGTWAQGAGNAIGMLGKPEQWLQKKLGVPEFGEYGDYYIDRQLANMTAEGAISAEDAQLAMMERTGATFDQARERVKMEMAMKVPTMAALMAGLTADNFVQGVGRAASTMPASLFGSALLPEGELEYRGLKPEWNEAWKKADAGDKTAIPEFFDEHPEYQAYLSKGKPPEERIKSFLIGQIWDGYMELGETNQKQARAQMGDQFSQSFLDKETRSYDTLTVEQLTDWAKMFGKKTPAATAPTSQGIALAETAPRNDMTLNLYDPQVTQYTDAYFAQRKEKFPNYYQTEQGYYNIPKSERTAYLMAHPDLKQYWNWKDSWAQAHPELVPIFKGQVFKEVDTSGWSPYLVDYVSQYAMTGDKLGKGATAALTQQWIMAGSPYGDVQSWLNNQVVPAMLYGGGQ